MSRKIWALPSTTRVIRQEPDACHIKHTTFVIGATIFHRLATVLYSTINSNTNGFNIVCAATNVQTLNLAIG